MGRCQENLFAVVFAFMFKPLLTNKGAVEFTHNKAANYAFPCPP